MIFQFEPIPKKREKIYANLIGAAVTSNLCETSKPNECENENKKTILSTQEQNVANTHENKNKI